MVVYAIGLTALVLATFAASLAGAHVLAEVLGDVTIATAAVWLVWVTFSASRRPRRPT
jgi:hypothetical protein